MKAMWRLRRYDPPNRKWWAETAIRLLAPGPSLI